MLPLGNMVEKGTWDLSVWFFTTPCESTIISSFYINFLKAKKKSTFTNRGGVVFFCHPSKQAQG